MNENTVVISQERYEELLRNDVRLKIIFDVATHDEASYGYERNTAEIIDAVLGIKR